MAISSTGAYNNLFLLVSNGISKKQLNRTLLPPDEAPKTNQFTPEEISEIIEIALSKPSTFELKFQDDSPDAIAARVAVYHAKIAEMAKSDPDLAFTENLKDKYMHIKAERPSSISIRGDGIIETKEEANARVRNLFAPWCATRLKEIINSMEYISNGGNNKEAVLQDMSQSLERLVEFASSNKAMKEAKQLTLEYMEFKTGAAVSLNELGEALGVFIPN